MCGTVADLKGRFHVLNYSMRCKKSIPNKPSEGLAGFIAELIIMACLELFIIALRRASFLKCTFCFSLPGYRGRNRQGSTPVPSFSFITQFDNTPGKPDNPITSTCQMRYTRGWCHWFGTHAYTSQKSHRKPPPRYPHRPVAVTEPFLVKELT